jgi:hypothetical protein
MINTQELYQQYLDEGYTSSLALQMAKEEVAQRTKNDKRSVTIYNDIRDRRLTEYVNQPLPLHYTSPGASRVLRIRTRRAV